MFLFDSDHIVIAQQQTQPEYDNLIARVRQHAPDQFYTSIVSFHEQVMGWNAYISQAPRTAGVARGYGRLQQMLANYCQAQILPFDDVAADTFDDLRKLRVRIGTMDLRIAAIAISRDMVVLTRNLADFSQVPGLKVEDWTLP